MWTKSEVLVVERDMGITLSVLDLAWIAPGGSARDAFDASIQLAQAAEREGYHRVWYAEHHNMPTIASSATSVVIGHIAANTTTIRVGAGGIMLPNHSPLVIAEQFGTLETLYPDRIDLGLGRAPGSDQATMHAMRRDPMSAESFPRDVLELQGYLRGQSRVTGVNAYPGHGTNVPLYILGSSLFGAQLAAQLGLPFGFASHFAPDSLFDAVEIYRSRFEPSEQLDAPYTIVGVNVIAADSEESAREQHTIVRRSRVRSLIGRSGPGAPAYTDEEIDVFLTTPNGRHIANMTRYSAVGEPDTVASYLRDFARSTGADELMIAHQSQQPVDRIHSLELTARALRDVEATDSTEPVSETAVSDAVSS